MASPARGDSGAAGREPIRIVYDVAAGCPSYEGFSSNVRRYTTRWRVASDTELDARTFRVVLRGQAASTIGTLELGDGGPPSTARRIVGPDCDAVARALAIALAVMIDPAADITGSGAANEEDDSPSEAIPAKGVVDEPPAAPPAPREPPPQPQEPAHAERPARHVPPAEHPLLGFEASVGLTSAVVDGLTTVVGAAVELEPLARFTGTSSLPRWFRPAIALGARQSLPKAIERAGLTSDFTWTVGTVRLCPVRAEAFDGHLELSPCFEMNAGTLRAEAKGSRDARTNEKPWLDMAAVGRVTWHVHGPWYVGGTFALVAPITRYRFELSTEISISQAPSTGITFGPWAGVRF